MNGYEGCPAQLQIERTTTPGKELAIIVAEFGALTKNRLPAVNAALTKNSLDSIAVTTREEWEKRRRQIDKARMGLHFSSSRITKGAWTNHKLKGNGRHKFAP